MKEEARSRLKNISAMVIFGTIGVFRKFIPLSSGFLAMMRGYIGALFLVGVMLVRRTRPVLPSSRKDLILLILSGAAIGINWVMLFEAYRYTSVATATLCYYMAPVFFVLAAPFVLKEKLTVKKVICVIISLVGMVFVSGVLETGLTDLAELKGIALGVGAAVLYASDVLMNKKVVNVSPYDKTVIQLFSAALAVTVYEVFAGESEALVFEPLTVVMLGVVCIVHTGIAYALYFGSLKGLSSTSIALLSYIDPVLAVLLSALFLREEMTLYSVIGAVLIIGGAMAGEINPKNNKTIAG